MGGEGERERIGGCSEPEFDSIFQVDVERKKTSISPLSPWERARVRVPVGFSALHDLRQ
jgi:hypothetical protein